MINNNIFSEVIKEQGFLLQKNILQIETCTQLKIAIEKAIVEENNYHGNTTQYATYGALLFAPVYNQIFIELLENENLMQPFNFLLGNNSKLYTISTACVPPQDKIYTARIHRDSNRNSIDFELVYACMIFVTDVTEENGAPYYLKGSHLQDSTPDKDFFFNNAERITGKTGDVLYFNPLVWHSGTFNNSDNWRHTIIIGMCKNFVQQRFDIPHIISGLNYKNLSSSLLQKLGFKDIPPKSYDEYYNKV